MCSAPVYGRSRTCAPCIGRSRPRSRSGRDWSELTAAPAPLGHGVEDGTSRRRIERGHGAGRQQESARDELFEHRNVLSRVHGGAGGASRPPPRVSRYGASVVLTLLSLESAIDGVVQATIVAVSAVSASRSANAMRFMSPPPISLLGTRAMGPGFP